MKKTLAVLLSILLLTLSLPFAVAGTPEELRFRDDGTFTILNLSDTQDDAHPAPDMLRLLELAVETADPDLIVINGDLVEDRRYGDNLSDDQPTAEGVNVYDKNGEIDHDRTRENVEKAISCVMGTLEKYEVPYAIALGDNDRKVGLSSEEWIEILSAYPHCVFFDESPDGAGGVDYHVSVKGTDGTDKLTVWLMDTGRSGVTDEQVNWYKETAAAIAAENGGTPVPAFSFQHIHTDDIGNLFVPCKATDEGAKKSADGYVRLDRTVSSGYNFFSYEPGARTYQFEGWKASGDVMGVFFGHMHVEGFSGVWDGIELGFTYGCEMAKTGPWGFRVLKMNEDDVRSYSNETYQYKGSARLGTAKVEKYEDGPSQAERGRVVAFLLKFVNLFRSLISAIVYLFR